MKHGDGDGDDDEDDDGEGEEGEEDEEESGDGGGVERERERRRERKKQTRTWTPRHLCSCANHSDDHGRLLEPAVQAGASKALAGSELVKKKNCSTVKLFGPCFKTGRTRQKTRVHVSWSITGGARNGRLWRARARTPSICE